MPSVSLRKRLYDEIVRNGEDVNEFVNTHIKQAIKQRFGKEAQ